jgi:hypothetical protein
MKTDPAGPVFVSYVRERSAAIEMLVRALHDVGVPTWLDTDDLGAGPFADDIVRMLASTDTSGAILFLSPETEASGFVRDVEAPAVMRRAAARDGFWTYLVAAGGLDAGTAPAVLAGALGREDAARWNIQSVGEPFTEVDAATVARKVLRERLAAIHAGLPPGEPLRVRLDARQRGPIGPSALSIDWSPHFQPAASATTWTDVLLPALSSVRDVVVRYSPGRPVDLSGYPTLSCMTAFGAAFAAPLDLPVRWHQVMLDGSPSQVWSLEASGSAELAAERGWICTHNLHHVASAQDVAVLVNVTDDVAGAFGRSAPTLPPFRVVVSVDHRRAVEAAKQGRGRPDIVVADPAEASSLARLAMSAVRQARRDGATGSVHLFVAGPAGLSLMLGQLSNTFNTVVSYDYRPASGDYVPAAVLPFDPRPRPGSPTGASLT